MRQWMLLAATAVAMVSGVAMASAQDKIKLKVADSFPAGHYSVAIATKPFMAEVTKRTQGAVEFEYFPSEQVGKAKDMLSLVQSGIVDIAYTAPLYISDKFPLSEAISLPGMFQKICPAAHSFWKLAKSGILYTEEYAKLNVRPMWVSMTAPYVIVTKSKKVTSSADLKGMKIRAAGNPVEQFLKASGAVPVKLSAPETYEGLLRGTIDGAAFPLRSIESYGLHQVLKHGLLGVSTGAFVGTYTISAASWSKLPPHVQKVMNEVGDEIVASACEAAEKDELTVVSKLTEMGMAFNEAPPALVTALQSHYADTANDWAARLDRRGKPGTEVLKQLKAEIAGR